GAGDLRAVNLLHSYGGLQVGRHGEMSGPHGARSVVPLAARRPLRPGEQALLVAADATAQPLLQEMAADFDSAVTLARPDGPDLVLLRVASLDLLTHGNFPATAAGGQNDGRPTLFAVYRYMDRRLGELYDALDGNDVLVVMSDHGIRTALQHDPQAMFVAVGASVPAGRLPDEPELRGVPRMIADFFGLASAWPATGIERWVPGRQPRPAAAPAAP
ncbi:MAG TPA: alkaline phosphatase family protein, partial [Thermoanaerobaculia bacterium]|nr:alkaline phosphatase family protein [Thermoanaerobaculia bacterium]